PSAPGAPAPTQFAAAQPAQAPANPVTPAAAPAQAAEAANAAPVIALPESAPAANGQPMMFSLDGAMPMQASNTAAQPPAPVAAPALAQVATRPLGAPARYLPTPARSMNSAPAAMPAVTVPVSNGSARSNVPITGRAPNASANAATSAAMQRAMAGQDVSRTMTPPSDAGSQTASNPDWFSAAWGQALDKYQRTNQLNGKPPTTITVE
ncbi:MAG: hypothetical protein K2X44_06315, partial [Magnetospirillum sp.]|nr:hypothetical protein [Magnetospirillum sp.]